MGSLYGLLKGCASTGLRTVYHDDDYSACLAPSAQATQGLISGPAILVMIYGGRRD